MFKVSAKKGEIIHIHQVSTFCIIPMIELEILAITSVLPFINQGIAVFKKKRKKLMNEKKKNESKQKRGLK